MKIHLIRTPEYEVDNLKEVHQILNSYKGPMEFVMKDFQFDKDDYDFLESDYPLSWEELFSLCVYYRTKYRIRKDDFIVLITYKTNSLNWFSHCDESKNVFIHAAEWEKFYVKAHHKYPVAYQVIENVLQNLMEIDSVNGNNEYVHSTVRGCINDFCEDKREVILKLRTADICEKCIKRISEKEIPVALIDQVFQILEGLRTQFLFKKNINRFAGPFSVFIDENYKLLIPQLGNKELILEPLFSTLYILFLLNPEGIKLKNLIDFKQELKEIYKYLNPNLNSPQIEKRIEDITNPLNGSFSQKKSKINKKIKDQLGDTISQHFLITGKPSHPFKINLSLVNSDIRF